MIMKNSIKKIVRNVFLQLVQNYKYYSCYKKYSKQFKEYLQNAGIPNSFVDGENEYLEKWHQLSKRVEPYSYRFYSTFLGKTPYIVPEDIGHTIIEEILNPSSYRKYYSDKNMFPIIIGEDKLPKTILCRINGGKILDGDYHVIEPSAFHSILANYSSVIIKPSIETGSGKGVKKFIKHGEDFINNDTILSYDFLMSYGDDFCLQECLTQSDYINKFNPTSINTLRIAVYRSVIDESFHCVSAIIRIGRKGEFVDNIHAGGKFVAINVNNGCLGKYVFDELGNKSTIWNDIDFFNNDFYIPNWDEVIPFAFSVCSNIKHHRLIALDLALDKNNHPKVIEYNLNEFSYWLFMITGQIPLGKYTDEIICYCKNNI